MDNEECSICGENLENEYTITLKCKHIYHYQCIFLSFKNTYENSCPLCRQIGNKLPLINGIKKIYPFIHDIKEDEIYDNKPCNAILKRGKNKGNECKKNCKLGYDKCKAHLKMNH